jgi:Flp pilus assembly protein TadD
MATQDRLKEAIDMYVEGVQMNPADARAHSAMGEVYTRSADWERAAAAFEKAAELDPGEPRHRRLLAAARLQGRATAMQRSASEPANDSQPH